MKDELTGQLQHVELTDNHPSDDQHRPGQYRTKLTRRYIRGKAMMCLHAFVHLGAGLEELPLGKCGEWLRSAG